MGNLLDSYLAVRLPVIFRNVLTLAGENNFIPALLTTAPTSTVIPTVAAAGTIADDHEPPKTVLIPDRDDPPKTEADGVSPVFSEVTNISAI